MKRIDVTDIQWIVEWWHISSMVNRVFKNNCVPLVGLHRYSYYSPNHITRQFGDCQGIASDDGVFNISVFTKRVLDRIRETWLKRMVAKDIRFPQFLHPTSGLQSLANLKWVPIDEKTYKRFNKRKKANSLP